MWNDTDLEMAELASAANDAARTKGRRAFDAASDGPALAAAVRDAVDFFHSVYAVTTAVADDYGFAHDDAADAFAFKVAQDHQRAWEQEMRNAR